MKNSVEMNRYYILLYPSTDSDFVGKQLLPQFFSRLLEYRIGDYGFSPLRENYLNNCFCYFIKSGLNMNEIEERNYPNMFSLFELLQYNKSSSKIVTVEENGSITSIFGHTAKVDIMIIRQIGL